MEKKLAKVVYCVRDQSCESKIVCSFLKLLRCEVVQVDTGQVQEGISVIRSIFTFGLSVLAIYFLSGRCNKRGSILH